VSDDFAGTEVQGSFERRLSDQPIPSNVVPVTSAFPSSVEHVPSRAFPGSSDPRESPAAQVSDGFGGTEVEDSFEGRLSDQPIPSDIIPATPAFSPSVEYAPSGAFSGSSLPKASDVWARTAIAESMVPGPTRPPAKTAIPGASAALDGSGASGNSEQFGETALLYSAALTHSASFAPTVSLGGWEAPGAAGEADNSTLFGLDLWLFIVIVAGVILAAILILWVVRRRKAVTEEDPLQANVTEEGESQLMNDETCEHDFVNPLMENSDLEEIASEVSFSPASLDEMV
jgi:hypothetical protein